MEILDSAMQGIKAFIPRREPRPSLEILNEQLQYILKYKERIGEDDVKTIINTPHYELLAPYFGLKLFDKNPEVQRELLQIIVNSLNQTPDYSLVKEKVNEFLHNGYEINEVSPNKLSRFALWGPSFVQKRAEEVMEQVKERGETPAIVAYSGLVALKPVVCGMEPGDKSYMVFPNMAQNSTRVGYMFFKTPEKIEVKDVERQDLLHESNVAIIDDAEHTGKTLQAISSLFPHASVRGSTLFKT